MTGYSVIIDSEAARKRARDWLDKVPFRWVVEFKEQKRNNDQNALMWALLSEVSAQKEHAGMKLTPETWKCVFMHELGFYCQFIPALNGNGVLPLGYHSSRLTKSQMSDLIEIILKWGAENGVTFREREAA